MKKIPALFIYTLLIIGCISCGRSTITDVKDYGRYLQPGHSNAALQLIDTDLLFWNTRLEQMPGDIISSSRIAGLLSRRFSYSGDIREVKEADSIYRSVNVINRVNSSATYRALAANCVIQHQFQQAKMYIDSAMRLGDDKYLTILMQFDVWMELGRYYEARWALNSLADKKSFEYLIREAKYKDHVEGDLDAAIQLMEQAFEEVKNNPALWLWTKSNLGDMYGHANRFRDSYRSYLDVLAKDPHYYHALKGIAWLAFSHDKDVAGAKRIVLYLQQQHPVPDYDLLLAEFAEFEGDDIAKDRYLQTYMSATQNPLYGGMYNKYTFGLLIDDLHNPERALHIAQREVSNRPTPEAYCWLSWAYCQNGDSQQGMQTARHYVENKCFEPGAAYYLGLIYKAGGNTVIAKKYLKAAKESSFELGPVVSKHIDQLLANL